MFLSPDLLWEFRIELVVVIRSKSVTYYGGVVQIQWTEDEYDCVVLYSKEIICSGLMYMAISNDSPGQL